jgi:hypothetical protein
MVWSGCQGELLFQEEPRAKPPNRPCRFFHVRRIIRHDRHRHRRQYHSRGRLDGMLPICLLFPSSVQTLQGKDDIGERLNELVARADPGAGIVR